MPDILLYVIAVAGGALALIAVALLAWIAGSLNRIEWQMDYAAREQGRRQSQIHSLLAVMERSLDRLISLAEGIDSHAFSINRATENVEKAIHRLIELAVGTELAAKGIEEAVHTHGNEITLQLQTRDHVPEPPPQWYDRALATTPAPEKPER